MQGEQIGKHEESWRRCHSGIHRADGTVSILREHPRDMSCKRPNGLLFEHFMGMSQAYSSDGGREASECTEERDNRFVICLHNNRDICSTSENSSGKPRSCHQGAGKGLAQRPNDGFCPLLFWDPIPNSSVGFAGSGQLRGESLKHLSPYVLCENSLPKG